MAHSPEWQDGRRNGIKWAIVWLHEHANEMNDQHAKAILNTAAFHMGVEAKATDIPRHYPPVSSAMANK